MSESDVPGRLTNTVTGTAEFWSYTAVVGNREFPFKVAMPVPGTVSANNILIADANKAISGLLGQTFTGATGTNTIKFPDNLADGLSIGEDGNAYVSYVSTDGSESVAFKKRVTTTDGVASGTAKTVGGMALVAVSAVDTVLASVSNNAFVSFAGTCVLPASTLKLATMMRIRAQITVNNASGADTLTCNIRLGGTSLIATTAVDPGATTDHHVLEFTVVARAAPGATASCVGHGRWETNTGGVMAAASAILAPTNFATNGALTVDVQAKWSSNTASTSARLEILNVEVF